MLKSKSANDRTPHHHSSAQLASFVQNRSKGQNHAQNTLWVRFFESLFRPILAVSQTKQTTGTFPASKTVILQNKPNSQNGATLAGAMNRRHHIGLLLAAGSAVPALAQID